MHSDQHLSQDREQAPSSILRRWNSNPNSKPSMWLPVDPRALQRLMRCPCCKALVLDFDRDDHEQSHAA